MEKQSCNPADLMDQATETRQPNACGHETRPRTILIIDDEEAIQMVIRFGLQMTASWTVLTADSGLTGVQIAQAEQPDAILLDYMMPKMDGMATLKALQSCSETNRIPVIFLTAKVQSLEEQLQTLGISGVITKPFNALDLSKQIAKILEWIE
ncbi:MULTISPECIES: response regulator [Leptolyngbya]|jgi:two-component system alkaline phosphatase synthesis response regulator PhoP|uniref:Complementary adaptation response regulator homolog n=2 Tax=Leptolyngbya boryana TaxID=1184 RepID=A0A1Z4JK01_LEPBY|nr:MULTISPECIES: response regulator [Leptolyngbya]BAY57056.1 complementary adaptation response regulator homolog [Leptolyngbya boryana NIES-2135]MCY6494385.1 response regulator [Leptolyngbya sp. GGD]ULP28186.1 response regulator [Leptolyngbya boryana IU 594]WNZ46524.1 response regulator [Leptolyngbya boryana CZ1]BAS56763.1 complementary adaptation response regulator homolog [Leptolyngbya boryana IAM M-101]